MGRGGGAARSSASARPNVRRCSAQPLSAPDMLNVAYGLISCSSPDTAVNDILLVTKLKASLTFEEPSTV